MRCHAASAPIRKAVIADLCVAFLSSPHDFF